MTTQRLEDSQDGRIAFYDATGRQWFADDDANFTLAPGATGTTVTLTASPSLPASITYPATITFTATISPSGPTGTVVFTLDGDAFAAVDISGTTAVTGAITLSVGTHSIVARYGGDTTYAASDSSAGSVTVAKQATATTFTTTDGFTLGAVTSPIVYLTNVDWNVAVTPSTPATHTGFVKLLQGTTILTRFAVNSDGTGTTNQWGYVLGVGGPYSMTFEYEGDANHTGSVSSAVSFTVNKEPTTTTLVISPASPAPPSVPITFTATVKDHYNFGPNSNLTVEFYNGVTLLGTGATDVNATGNASFTTSSLASGTMSVTAKCVGNANYDISTSSAQSYVVGTASTTSIVLVAAPASPAQYGATVNLTATISPSGPTGNIVFTDGGSTFATVALSGTTAVTPLGIIPAGTHTLQASYGGSGATWDASTSAPVSFVVTLANTTTAVTASPVSPSGPGVSVTFYATISPEISGTPTGHVDFYIDGDFWPGYVTGTNSPLVGGVASSPSISSLVEDTYRIDALYSGDSNFADSQNFVDHVVGEGGSLDQTLTPGRIASTDAFFAPTTAVPVTVLYRYISFSG